MTRKTPNSVVIADTCLEQTVARFSASSVYMSELNLSRHDSWAQIKWSMTEVPNKCLLNEYYVRIPLRSNIMQKWGMAKAQFPSQRRTENSRRIIREVPFPSLWCSQSQENIPTQIPSTKTHYGKRIYMPTYYWWYSWSNRGPLTQNAIKKEHS